MLISGISFLPISHRASHPGAAITCLEAICRVPELAAIAHAMLIIAGIQVIAIGGNCMKGHD
jgi:hypothetical protein